jgi:hypothetical protein
MTHPGAQLPPALAAWSASLAALDDTVAAALGPMLLRLDEMVGRQGGIAGSDGEPDGFDGLARKGSPERLLIGEWLLAEEIPEEFLRRAAEGELLHLARAHRHDPPLGVVRVLVDTGPDQLGAGRLVQLAALIVLHRRAVRIGAAVEIGVLGAVPGDWFAGDLPELLQAWLSARRHQPPSAEDVRGWVSDGALVWLLCSPQLLIAVSSLEHPAALRQRVLTSTESGWDGEGARTVQVRLAGEGITLSLPSGPEAVRALRGQGFRRSATALPASGDPSSNSKAFRYPVFPGPARRLVGRGEDQGELAWVTVGEQVARTGAKVRRRRFPGTVLAVGAIGARLVVLHAHDDVAEIRVIGKTLGQFQGLLVPLSELGLDPMLSAVDPDGSLETLLYDGGTLLCRLAGRWYRVGADGDVHEESAIVTAIATEVADRPQIAVHGSGHDRDAGPRITLNRHIRGVPAGAEVRLGHHWAAWSSEPTQWHVAQGGESQALRVGAGEQVRGVVEVNAMPALVTESAAGLVLRLVQMSGTRTLTAWSNGDPRMPAAVHPSLPLIAVVTADGVVEIVDLAKGRTLQRVLTST